jgi:hypothetical protein
MLTDANDDDIFSDGSVEAEIFWQNVADAAQKRLTKSEFDVWGVYTAPTLESLGNVQISFDESETSKEDWIYIRKSSVGNFTDADELIDEMD